jgi:hypothetical protein
VCFDKRALAASERRKRKRKKGKRTSRRQRMALDIITDLRRGEMRRQTDNTFAIYVKGDSPSRHMGRLKRKKNTDLETHEFRREQGPCFSSLKGRKALCTLVLIKPETAMTYIDMVEFR